MYFSRLQKLLFVLLTCSSGGRRGNLYSLRAPILYMYFSSNWSVIMAILYACAIGFIDKNNRNIPTFFKVMYYRKRIYQKVSCPDIYSFSKTIPYSSFTWLFDLVFGPIDTFKCNSNDFFLRQMSRNHTQNCMTSVNGVESARSLTRKQVLLILLKSYLALFLVGITSFQRRS